MPPEIEALTRHEVVGYITALVAILLRRAPHDPDEADVTMTALEELVFLPEWHAARPAYQQYFARCREVSPADPTVMPRQKVLLIRFRQVLIDIWGVSPELLLEDGIVQRYCEALTALHERVERKVLEELS
jgi:hypothetical protein